MRYGIKIESDYISENSITIPGNYDIKNICLIVDETSNVCLCSSMQKKNISCEKTENSTTFTFTQSLDSSHEYTFQVDDFKGTGEVLNILDRFVYGYPLEENETGLTLCLSKDNELVGYTSLNYIQSNGTQYIDTGILANSNNGFEISFQIVSFTNSEFLGGGEAYGNGLGICTHGGGTLGLICGTTNIKQFSPGTTNHIVSIKNNTAVVDGVVMGTSTTSYTTQKTFYIFRKNPYGSTCSYKCHYLKLWDNNGNLVRDFIPVLDSSGRPCMYDRITHQPFYNQGTGEFIYEIK